MPANARINYKNAPLHRRLGLAAPIQHVGANPLGAPFNLPGWGEQLANAFSSSYEIDGAPIGDPDTPILRAYQGDPMRVHVLQSGDRARMVETEISGHNWLEHAFDAGSVRTGVQGSMATGSAFTFYLQGAGGDGQNVGDYKYGVVHAVNGMSAGSWGILRVYPKPAPGTERELTPLEGSDNPYAGGHPIQVLDQSQLRLGPDTVAPTVTSVDPVDGAKAWRLTRQVTVTFSESIKAATVTDQSLRLVEQLGRNRSLDGDVACRPPVGDRDAQRTARAGRQLHRQRVRRRSPISASNPLATPFTSTFTVATGAGCSDERGRRAGATAPRPCRGPRRSTTAVLEITGYRVDVSDAVRSAARQPRPSRRSDRDVHRPPGLAAGPRIGSP